MKPRHPLLPYAVLALAWLAFAAYVWISAGQLPPRVATHFGFHGEANGWESHAGYLKSTLLFSAAVPAFIFGIFSLASIGNGSLMNIPHKHYWLAPERRSETFAFVRSRGAWFACLLIAFFAALHHLVIEANAQSPANLPPRVAYWAGGLLVAGAAVLVAGFIRHFYRKPA